MPEAPRTVGTKTSITFGGLAASSIAVFLLAHTGIFPRSICQLLVIGVVFGWLSALMFYVARRFGRIGVGSTLVLGIILVGWFAMRYRQDIPKRHFVDAIKRFEHVHVFTTGLESG